MNIQIHHRESLDAKHWDSYVLAHPLADHYHLSGWGRVIKGAYKYEPLYLSAWQGADLKGVLPVVIMGGIFRRQSLVSLPFLDYGGICADDLEVAERLYMAVHQEAARRRGGTLDLRHRRNLQLPLTHYGDKVTLILQLENDAEKMWTSLGGKVRNQIRKAEKAQLQTQWVGEDGLEDFYRVYVCNMRALGSPPHSLRFFKRVLAEFSDTRVLLVHLENKVIGGGLCLVFKDTMLVPWASSLRSYFRLCPNNLLYWEAIRTACAQGLQRFDFGRSSRHSGTYKFKKQWGVLEESLHWQSNVPSGDLIDGSNNRTLGLVMEVWKRLPVGITRFIGPVLRRRISN